MHQEIIGRVSFMVDTCWLEVQNEDNESKVELC